MEGSAVSRALLDLLGGPAERIVLGDLLAKLGVRGPVTLMLVLALPNVLPMPPGTSAVLGAPLLALALRLAVGAEKTWLPRFISSRSIAKSRIAPAVRRIAALLCRPEHRGRMAFLAGPRAMRPVGWLCAFLALLLFLPIPFGNMPPALAISLCAIGILRDDGLWVLAGVLCGVAALAVVVGAAFGISRAVTSWLPALT
jgi:hypothetical protein